MSSVTSKRRKKPALESVRKKAVAFFVPLIIYALLFLAVGYFAFLFDFPSQQSFLLSIAACGVASFLTGFLAARKAGKQAIPIALLTTAPANAAVLLLALLSVRFSPDLRLAITAAVLLLCAALGGCLGVQMKQKPSFRPRRGRKQ